MPSTESRWARVVAACLGTRPRRLLFVGAMMLLGWLGVAIASAANASADPGGNGQPVAATHLLASVTEAQTAHHSAPHAAEPSSSLLGGVVPAVGQVVTRVSAPLNTPGAGVESPALAPAPAPASQPLSQDLQAVADAVRATEALSVRLPIVGLTIHIGPTNAATVPVPATSTPPAHLPALTFKVPAPRKADRMGTAVAARRPTAPSASADIATAARPLAASHSASAPRAGFGGARSPKPTPPAPPAMPDVALAGASGTASASKPGSGSGVYSARATETWAAQQLRLLGTAERTRSHTVRNSATKPPVVPD